MKKKSFVLYTDLLSSLDELSDEQAGKLFKAIRAYFMLDEKGPSEGWNIQFEGYMDNFVIRLAFHPFRAAFERDAEKYQNLVERNRRNGSKGGRKKASDGGGEKKPTGTQTNPLGFLGTQTNPKEPKQTQNVYNDNDNVNDNDNIVVVADARAREREPVGEGDGFDEMLTAFFAPERQGALEAFCMNLHIDMARLRSLAEEAVVGWRVNGQKRHSSLEDAFKHLTNTIRIKMHDRKANQRVYENNQTDRFSARRGAEPRNDDRKGYKKSL